ncbi:MAG: CDP-alcohol phosphatidyltransferase family protein [Methanomicrobiales archaeon]|jgi:archaetidylinositol phosphate synthase|nr:CDP-alcohol phosphatidyltransferase family protein [Methanomicrobiales archaeon]
MTLDSFRSHVQPIIEPVARAGIRIGLTPNSCTIFAFIAAICGGIAFYFNQVIFGLFCVLLNSIFDAIDGAIAREVGEDGTKGDFLDHTLDRYADIFLICGIFAGPLCSWEIGVFALVGVFMSSYMGTQAQAIGVGRFYGGVLGRADRLVLLLIGALATILIPAGVFGLTPLAIVLLIFGILGNITAVQRFLHVWKQVK